MKNTFLLSVLLVLVTTFTFSQESNYQLSSHILDITQGQPAIDVKISLSKQDNSGKWKSIDEKKTDKNGRINDFLKIEKGINHQGIYKLTYYTAPYFKLLGQESFYPFIEVVFELKDNNHYHVPITLSAFGYSTYRGN
ncbi:hydroxyisourate hydrolase [Tenacibaculum finnmarkense genomovar finnmarkense]|uniref:5-hydroxyisourate hydrolase n=1 Tax=Tenacibaculum finnmarkense genomovar finnmarkense TaxID=1458503 RepID=A0AAP1RFW2_9FLAO|nr:hydroxyisourate hydrolase [Tenacibaculum finnmarkense]MBE7653269.1 hydroxyisourate hydrolase [Tenacibaculum finnmarkense genomovar finnmarkense]MBE7661417.1 hydroxyisourate hydrolase [Tenacibaculum finnmarkense genomovar finnmarkense]MBE7695570.1 hydroxyisourate hydrolase [Tenacibaculum finnmarkense genomovar finnmarkense]MCD8412411.1 hydroxyisourate hydrolase [Tenacibaculum finnmarkense genomovar ulcerans]MCD8418268.1 hydroxyisourate hydrolase [Tenacibaculum finnmarkense genomovar finnmark